MMTEAQAELLARTLFAYYPNARVDEWNVTAYSEAFADMDETVVRAAITRVARTQKFLPTVAEICQACLANARGQRRSGEEAYAELMAAVRKHGRCYGDTKPPEFKDPIMTRCIGVWGTWNGLCNSPDDDASGRMRCIQLYNSLAEKDDQHAVLPEGLRVERQFGFAAARVLRPVPDALPEGDARPVKVTKGERVHYLPPRRSQAEIDAAARELLTDLAKDGAP